MSTDARSIGEIEEGPIKSIDWFDRSNRCNWLLMFKQIVTLWTFLYMRSNICGWFMYIASAYIPFLWSEDFLLESWNFLFFVFVNISVCLSYAIYENFCPSCGITLRSLKFVVLHKAALVSLILLARQRRRTPLYWIQAVQISWEESWWKLCISRNWNLFWISS